MKLIKNIQRKYQTSKLNFKNEDNFMLKMEARQKRVFSEIIVTKKKTA